MARNIPRLYKEGLLQKNQMLVLEGPSAHYILNVMRRNQGDDIRFFNGKDGEWLGKIIQKNKKTVQVKIVYQTQIQKKEPDIWMIFAPIRQSRLDFLIEKSTELGVSYFQPVMTEYTVVSRVNLPRIQKNIIEASEQCERLTVPQIAPLVAFGKFLRDWDQRPLVFCDEKAELGPKKSKTPPVAILIGPEGGFSDQERNQLQKHPQVTSISLGPRILRAETAAVVALSQILNSW